MKKLLAILLAATLLAALLPAALAEAPEPIVVTAFRGDPGDQPAEDNKIYKMIEDEFGIKFEFEFLAGDLDETLGLKIAGEDYPDLFDGGNSADLLINNGALRNLLDFISPEKTPNLWAHIEPQKARLIEKDEDGNDALYIIPNYGLADGEQIVDFVNGPAFFIQKQVLAWDNYPQIHTLNEYFDLIERFLAANPTDENGAPYVGFDILCEDWRHFCLINPVQHLMGRPNDGEVLIDVSTNDFKTETFIDKPYAKGYYKKLNEEFHKGLISKDTFVMNYDQYIAQLSSGTVLGMFDQYWDFSGTAEAALRTAGMDKNTYVALGLVYDPEYVDGQQIEEHYLNGTLPNVRRGFGISVNCDPEKAQRIVDMWEAMMTERWQLIFNWGIEGEDYYVENGRLLMTEEQYKNTQDNTWKLHNKANAFFESSPKKQGWIMDGQYAGNAWEVAHQPEIVLDQMVPYDKEFLGHYGFSTWADFVNPPIELAPYGEAWQIDYSPVDIEHQDFLNIQDKDLPEIIMADPAEFDAKWDAFVEEITPSASAFQEFMQDAVLKEAQKVLGNE